jgi:mono/diheme cytochrome c family protein
MRLSTCFQSAWPSVIALAVGCSRMEARDSDPRQLAERAWGWSALERRDSDPRHGEYLATIGACKECHTLRTPTGTLDQTKLFAGGIPFAGRWGLVATANVSQIAAVMPAEQLEDMIRGRLSYKFQMPTDLYQQMAADDMRDLIAYLRTLKPIERAEFPSHYEPGFHPPLPNPMLKVSEHPPQGITIERGRYLTTIAICKDCHSPRAADGLLYDEAHLFAGGGFEFRAADGRPVIPPNLTPDRETGVGSWSDAELVRAIRTGVAEDGHQLNPMMPYSVAMFVLTDQDVEAIVKYLRSLPPIRRLLPENRHWHPGDPPEECCFPVPRADLDAKPRAKVGE